MATCIACHEPVEGVVCKGVIRGVTVTFCVDDAKQCQDCESVFCTFEK